MNAAPAAAMPWRWAVAGAVLGAWLVLWWAAPARWLAAGLARASNMQVQLAQPQGTIWAGHASLVLTGGPGSRDRAALPGRVHWRIVPSGLGVTLALSADCCTPQGPLTLRLAPRWNGAQLWLADAESVWPAALLAGLGTPFNTIQPRGELTLQTHDLHVDWLAGRTRLAGSAELTARHVSSRLTTLEPMGSYQLRLLGGDSVGMTLTTLEGDLRLSGSGTWVGTRLRFRGEAMAAPGLEAQLANLLNILGQRRGNRAVMSFG